MKILSIDWDYYIDATANERIELFPDGGNENIPSYIRDYLWVSHYNDKLKNIGVKEKDLEITKKIIKNNFNSIMIADSHKHIYDFIEENYDFKNDINVTNIDFHHDLYGINDKWREDVDCGNWMVKLFQKYNCKYNWINQEDSDKDIKSNDELYKVNELKINDIVNEKYDLLYICKSSIWSPPHLDEKFIETFGPLFKQKDIKLIYEKEILKNRYNEDFKKSVEENIKMINQFKNNRNDIDR